MRVGAERAGVGAQDTGGRGFGAAAARIAGLPVDLRIPRLRPAKKIPMRLRHLFAIVALLPTAAVHAQAVQWIAGPLLYTPAIDFTTGYAANGTGYFVSQAYLPSPPQPTVGQGFYTRITMTGIVSPSVGRLMAVQFVPPAGTSVLVDPVNAPVRCFYRAMDASGSFIEFTNQAINDQSFGASLRVFGCPQPAAGGTPYPIVSVPGGTAFQFPRRDPQNQNAPLWPMGSQASYEFYIPLVANRTLGGFLEGDRFIAPIRSIQGDGIDPWTYPYVALLVGAGAGSVAADLAAGPQSPPAPPPPTRAGVTVVCANNGPNVASNVTCGFSNVPATATNVTVQCFPASTVASLAVGASFSCFLSMDRFIGTATVTGVVSSANNDTNLGNNTVQLSISGRLVDPIHASGFEPL
jgi:hypothetical protein